jgi:CubicO group peptidase (beta-lactamase class C family)
LAADADLDRTSLETFAEQMIVPALEESGVPAAILSVVSRDGILLSRAWGQADPATGNPANSQTTMFNIASIGKSFTAVLASQLIDEGLLEPMENVNRYLDQIEIENYRLTLHDLLGHQAGFDPDLTHLFVDLGEDASMSSQEMGRRLRLQHRPGEIAAYDNAGYGLIGLLLEAVTGKTYGQLLRERIFEPLGMRNAIYVYPDSDRTNLAACTVPLGPNKLLPCDYYPVYRASLRGAGGIAVSADSMARYMMMLLNHGELDGQRILSPEAFDALSDFDAYRAHPALPGLARSFTELNNTDRPEFVSGGSVPGFSSVMKIFPQAGVGIFFSFMGGQPPSFDAIPSRLLSWVLSNKPESPAAAAALNSLNQFAESYADEFIARSGKGAGEFSGGDHSSFEAIADVRDFNGAYFSPLSSRALTRRLLRLTQSIQLSAVDGASFHLRGMGLEQAGLFREIGPALYQGEHAIRVALAERDKQNVLTFRLSPANFVKEPWYRAAPWTIPLFMVSLLVLLTSVIYMLPRHAGRARKSAAAVLTGWLLLLLSLYLEMEFATWLTVVKSHDIAPTLWLSARYAGLGLMLAAVITPLRPKLLPNPDTGWSPGRLASVHWVLLTGSALSLLFVSVLWDFLAR